MKNFLFYILFLLFLFLSCRHKPEENVVARVGSKSLTLEEAHALIDTTVGTYNEQLHRVVSLWVNTELLYQEAQRIGILNEESFKPKVDEIKREVAVQRLLQKLVYTDTQKLSEDNVREYFEKHSAEFFVRDDAIQLNIIGFKTRSFANEFIKLASKEGWEKAFARIQSDSLVEEELIVVYPARYYTQDELFAKEIWKIALTLNNNEMSFPIKTSLGFFV